MYNTTNVRTERRHVVNKGSRKDGTAPCAERRNSVHHPRHHTVRHRRLDLTFRLSQAEENHEQRSELYEKYVTTKNGTANLLPGKCQDEQHGGKHRKHDKVHPLYREAPRNDSQCQDKEYDGSKQSNVRDDRLDGRSKLALIAPKPTVGPTRTRSEAHSMGIPTRRRVAPRAKSSAIRLSSEMPLAVKGAVPSCPDATSPRGAPRRRRSHAK